MLRDGELIDTVKSSEVTEDELKRLMVGRELGSHYYRTDYGEPVSEEVVLTVDNVSVPGEIENISFKLHKGEILGIGGLSECGMHELGKAIFAASFDRTGKVTLANGRAISSIPAAIRHSIAYASKDAITSRWWSTTPYATTSACPPSMIWRKNRILRDRKLNRFANKNAKMISVKMTGIHQFVSDLSGGNKQKVVLARGSEGLRHHRAGQPDPWHRCQG